MIKYFFILSLATSLIFVLLNCDNSTEPVPTTGQITGTVKKLGGTGSGIHPAFIFIENKLKATTDLNGNYTVSSLPVGTCQILCSALNYSDTTEQVQVVGGKSATKDFYLTPNADKGRVSGEFQDLTLFAKEITTNPDLANWSTEEIFAGVTGATLQSKTLEYQLPNRNVFLGDTLITVSDDFGQFWARIQCGTYSLKGMCEGYQDSSQVVRVVADSTIYITFFMRRNSPVTLAKIK